MYGYLKRIYFHFLTKSFLFSFSKFSQSHHRLVFTILSIFAISRLLTLSDSICHYLRSISHIQGLSFHNISIKTFQTLRSSRSSVTVSDKPSSLSTYRFIAQCPHSLSTKSRGDLLHSSLPTKKSIKTLKKRRESNYTVL